jgi:UDP-3-O-[3-hydroxymyristoyl] glucosamine N-acyltransferase
VQLKRVQELIGGDLEGNPDFVISAIAADPEQAKPDELAMIFATSLNKVISIIESSRALAFVINAGLFKNDKFVEFIRAKNNSSFIFVSRPKFALQNLLPCFCSPRWKPSQGVHPSAVVAEGAEIHPTASIGALCFIGPGVKIQAEVLIHPRVSIAANSIIGRASEIKSGVVIEDYVQIGANVTIHPNAVIGADGYSYTTQSETNLEKLQKGDFNFSTERQIQHKIQSAGTVIIEDDVEIGANTCIDRGNIKATRIGQGTKIDNLCQIAHNVQIGKDVLIIAKAGIAGSALIGDRVTMAGSSGCGDGVTIGNDAVVGAFSAANSDVAAFLPVLGAPAIAYGEFMKRQRAIARLPKQQEELRNIKSQLDKLTNKEN